MKHKITIEVLTLAFCIALFPPIWAVIAPHINVSTGAVALICAGLYVTNGNKRSDAVKISIGFLLGDFWAVFALKIMDIMRFLNWILKLKIKRCKNLQNKFIEFMEI